MRTVHYTKDDKPHKATFDSGQFLLFRDIWVLDAQIAPMLDSMRERSYLVLAWRFTKKYPTRHVGWLDFDSGTVEVAGVMFQLSYLLLAEAYSAAELEATDRTFRHYAVVYPQYDFYYECNRRVFDGRRRAFLLFTLYARDHADPVAQLYDDGQVVHLRL